MYKLTNMLCAKLWNNATNIRVVSQCFHMLENGNNKITADIGNALFKIVFPDALQVTERRARE